jgi:hypothetical protein
MIETSTTDAAKAVVRRNTEEVQGGGNFKVFEEDGARASSNWRPAKSAANLIIGMQRRS